MVMVVTNRYCTDENKLYNAASVALVLDTPAYNKSQPIIEFKLSVPVVIHRVNKVEECPDGHLIIHIV